MSDTLWGEEFSLSTKKDNVDILNKIKSTSNVNNKKEIAKQMKSKELTLDDKLAIIEENVNKTLGRYKNNVLVIENKEQLKTYLKAILNNGIVAFDTETNNTLDYLNCKLMGVCLYTPNEKQVYIPINHINKETNERLEWQLNEEDIKKFIQVLIDQEVKIIFHNYKFDYQVIKTTCNIEIPAYWDTMIGIKMIDETKKAKLKTLYSELIDPSQASYDIEDLFNGKEVPYAIIDPHLFALYSATDSYLTMKLYEYEKPILESKEYEKMYKIFREIEMPIAKITADMEYKGILIDQEYATRLKEKYIKKQEEINKQVDEELSKYKDTIEKWKLSKDALIKDGKKTKLELLSDPIDLNSPKQLAILLFDILKFPSNLGKSVKDKDRGTGANILKKLAKDYDFKLGDLLVKKKEIDKLLNTFILTLPTLVNPKDNKVHTNFHQLGAIARFSSDKPNLQNIPSSSKDIRPMFCASQGKVLISCDMSAAEVRASANSSKDPKMLKAYEQGKDLYAVVGSQAYNCAYEDCLEFYKEGTKVEYEGEEVIAGDEKEYVEETTSNAFHTYFYRLVDTPKGFIVASSLKENDIVNTSIGEQEIKEVITHQDLIYFRLSEPCKVKTKSPSKITNKQGKERRSNAKRILIGMLYGRGANSISEQIGVPIEQGKEIVDNFTKGFPVLTKWMEETKEKTKKLGFCEDFLGRRRHLPNATLPKYELKSLNHTINPFLNCEDNYIEPSLKEKYIKLLSECRSKEDFDRISKTAKIDNIEIINNSSKISEATRESLNWSCQAQTASWIKIDMINIANNKELKDLGFDLLLTIHDEVIGECPRENAEKCKSIILNIMSHCLDDILCVPMACDGNIEWSGKWYMSELETLINDKFNKYVNEGKSKEEAYEQICLEESELEPINIYNFLFKGDYLR